MEVDICRKYYLYSIDDNKKTEINFEEIKNAFMNSLKNKSNNYKQKLVYKLLEAVRNNDQKEFFYLVLRSINEPNDNLKKAWKVLSKYYHMMPENIFINFAYSIIIGIMLSYETSSEK